MNEIKLDPVNPVLRLARDFENAAEAYRDVRLHGPATDAEAKVAGGPPRRGHHAKDTHASGVAVGDENLCRVPYRSELNG